MSNMHPPKLALRSLDRLLVSTAVMVLMSLYYFWQWGSVSEFVLAIDHHPQLFQDFLGHYYPMGRSIDEADAPVKGYYYSAFFAVLLMPFKWLEPVPALWVWGLCQGVLMLGLSVTALRLLDPAGKGTAFAFSLLFWSSFPLIHNAKWGQVSVLLVWLTLLCFDAYRCRKPGLAGAALAVAAAIKFYPVVFLAWFMVRRDVRVLAATAAAMVACYVLVPLAVMGPAQWWSFEMATQKSLADAGWAVRDVNSQYIGHVLMRWLSLVDIRLGVAELRWLSAAGYVVFLSNMVLLWRARRLQDANDRRWLFGLVLIFLSLPMVIKTSWPHYFVHLAFCQVAVMLMARDMMPASALRTSVTLLAVASAACSSYFMFDLFPDWRRFSQLGMLFVSNGLLLVAVHLLGWRQLVSPIADGPARIYRRLAPR
ncbi:MAG: alpha,2-mannosyltransferase [Betaproteobacteria bacterium]|nr:alpha,2-mannosyltransferase [Betaproteobacteria bacterium]